MFEYKNYQPSRSRTILRLCYVLNLTYNCSPLTKKSSHILTMNNSRLLVLYESLHASKRHILCLTRIYLFACGQYYSSFLYCHYVSFSCLESDVEESSLLIPLCFNLIILKQKTVIYRSGLEISFLIASYNSAYELGCHR